MYSHFMQLHLAQSERSRFGQLRLCRVYTYTVVSVLAGIRSASAATATFPRGSALIPADDIFKVLPGRFFAQSSIGSDFAQTTRKLRRKRPKMAWVFLHFSYTFQLSGRKNLRNQ